MHLVLLCQLSFPEKNGLDPYLLWLLWTFDMLYAQNMDLALLRRLKPNHHSWVLEL